MGIPLEDMILLLVRLGGGFIASFLGVWVWSRTRNPAWTLAVLGVLSLYVQVAWDALVLIGVAEADLWAWREIGLLRLGLTALPYLLFAAAFLVWLIRNRRY